MKAGLKASFPGAPGWVTKVDYESGVAEVEQGGYRTTVGVNPNSVAPEVDSEGDYVLDVQLDYPAGEDDVVSVTVFYDVDGSEVPLGMLLVKPPPGATSISIPMRIPFKVKGWQRVKARVSGPGGMAEAVHTLYVRGKGKPGFVKQAGKWKPAENVKSELVDSGWVEFDIQGISGQILSYASQGKFKIQPGEVVLTPAEARLIQGPQVIEAPQSRVEVQVSGGQVIPMYPGMTVKMTGEPASESAKRILEYEEKKRKAKAKVNA